MCMRSSKDVGLVEYEKAICFLEVSCNCGRFQEKILHEAFQTLSRSKQDIFVMTLKAMNGGETIAQLTS